MSAITLGSGAQQFSLRSELILAPLDGYGDMPFRLLCQEFGSGANYIPFIGAEELLATSPRLHKRIDFSKEERPVILQLVGNHKYRILQAAHRAEDMNVDAIDLNLGCSAKGVSSRGAGSGLLRDPRKIELLSKQLVEELTIPVTAKIRLGWDASEMNYLTVARILENAGVQMIAVHGRTRMQGYKGDANWDAIAEIKQQASVPIIGNGDIKAADDIPRLIAHTGCDAVMIGRAAVNNPWIFQRRDRIDIPGQEVLDTIHHHLDLMCTFYGETRGLTLFRKYLTGYLEPYALPRTSMLPMLTCTARSTFNSLLASLDPASLTLPSAPGFSLS